MKVRTLQLTLQKYKELVYTKKLNYLEKMDKFLETHELSKQTHEEIENLNRCITSEETE